MTLTLYTNPQSRGRIARWMLEEIGQPYERKIVTFGPEMHGPDYTALNPMAKVPTLVHDGAVITELAAICAYLADTFPDAGLAPAIGAPERGPYLRWLFFAAGPMEHAVTNRSLKLDPPAERSGMVGYGSYEKVFETLDAALSATPYLTGEAFTAADLYLGAQINFGLQFKTMPDLRSFRDYSARLMARAAHKRASDLDNADIPPPEDATS